MRAYDTTWDGDACARRIEAGVTAAAKQPWRTFWIAGVTSESSASSNEVDDELVQGVVLISTAAAAVAAATAVAAAAAAEKGAPCALSQGA